MPKKKAKSNVEQIADEVHDLASTLLGKSSGSSESAMTPEVKEPAWKKNLKPFVKGQSGNPSGVKKNKPLTDALNAALEANNGSVITELVEKAIEQAKDGDIEFFKLIYERIEGKARSSDEDLEVNKQPTVILLPATSQPKPAATKAVTPNFPIDNQTITERDI